MAYKKTFNPDALPAHAEPEQAAQALSQFHIQDKPRINSIPANVSPSNQARPAYSNTLPQQQPPRPQNIKTSQSQYNQPYNQQPPANYRYNSNNNNNYNNNSNHNNYPASQSPPVGQNWNARPPAQKPNQQWATNTQNYPPRTPAPPDPDSADLYPLFRAANVSGTGSLTKTELGSALVNADFTPFDPRTISSLIRMFSKSPPGQPDGPTITYNEFQNLWRFLAEWRNLFERFDEDRSGRISLDEFSNAIVAFGYRLSTPFITVLYKSYTGASPERRGSRGAPQAQGMSFDLFVQACTSLKHMTDSFKSYDEDRDGYVTLSFEEFLAEMLRMLEWSQ